MPLSSDFKQVHFRLPAFRIDWMPEDSLEVFAQTFAPAGDRNGSLIGISQDITVAESLWDLSAKYKIITSSRTCAQTNHILDMSVARTYPKLCDAILASTLVPFMQAIRAMEQINANLRLRNVCHRIVYGRDFILVMPKNLPRVLTDLPELKHKLLLDFPALNIPFGAVFLWGGTSAHAKLIQIGRAAEVTQLYRELYLGADIGRMLAVQQADEIWE